MRLRTLILSAALLLVVAACASEGGDSTTTSGGATTTEGGGATTTAGDAGTTTTAGGDSSTTAAGDGAADGLHGIETELGTVIADADGFALYVFTNDTDGESTCYDSCAATWPPVPGDSTVGGDLDASLFSTVARTDGTEQLTVNGQPLYRYTPDAAGDTTGQGVGGVWFVVGTDGAMIGPEASADVAPAGDDFDY
jgi:predicted lipoprotein with Yx(FWY)xxD motif